MDKTREELLAEIIKAWDLDRPEYHLNPKFEYHPRNRYVLPGKLHPSTRSE